MPEIKHTFTGGKMNKDLDERLIPNGQYRDAVNIQVSTSEGSDVGTAQNILGNSIVPGQGFISGGARCVGSISNEKDDKLYWFVLTYGGDELITNGSLDSNADGWNSNSGTGANPIFATLPSNGWSYDAPNKSILATDVEKWKGLHQSNVNILRGRTYIVRCDVSNFATNCTGDLSPVIIDEGGFWTRPGNVHPIPGQSYHDYRNFAVTGNGSWEWVLTASVGNKDGQEIAWVPPGWKPYHPSQLYFQNRAETNPANDGYLSTNKLNCSIDNISIQTIGASYVLQYDTKKNTVRPVFTDTDNSVLKLQPDKLITGINIIDDMLFWTDNNSEPKKINIKRSIEGTSVSGNQPSYIINPKQNISFGNYQYTEENITVIKKPPKHPPRIISPNFRDDNLDYAGVIKISDNFSHPNSFIDSSIGKIHDFSFLKVGDTFSTTIETDINNSDEFNLQWSRGDKVVLKAFEENGLAPETPIIDYKIKGTITDWWGNSFSNTNFTLTSNGNMIEGGGVFPDDWGRWNTYWTWDKTQNKIITDGDPTAANNKCYHYLTLGESFQEGERYKIKYTIEPPDTGAMLGKVIVWVNDDDDSVEPSGNYFRLGSHTTPGEYEHEILYTTTLSGDATFGQQGPSAWTSSAQYLNSIVFTSNPSGAAAVGPQIIDCRTFTSTTVGTFAGTGVVHAITGHPNNTNPQAGGWTWNNWEIFHKSGVRFLHYHIDESAYAGASSSQVVYLNNVHPDPLVIGEQYIITFTVSNMTTNGGGQHKLGVSSSCGVSSQVRIAKNATSHGQQWADATPSDPWTGKGGYITETFTATGGRIDLFATAHDGMSTTVGPNGQMFVSLSKVETPTFKGKLSNVEVQRIDATVARVEVKIDAIDGTPESVRDGQTNLNYAIDLYQEEADRLFEHKFIRFAYRYKYLDGEVSPMSPFSNVVFNPGSFDYHPKKGYNLGMVNNLKQIVIKDYSKNLPKDVVAVDLLYKEENSPNIYIVDSPKDFQWPHSSYEVKGETSKGAALPSNQLLRPWDNVPKKALAQEIVGNRIVYGNYTQGHSLKSNHGTDFELDLEVWNDPLSHDSKVGRKSIKSLRDYQVGIVFGDEYGRETPILTTPNATTTISKDGSSTSNQLTAIIYNREHPVNMKYFKFFVKDNGGEYYNLAMDRFYDAEDSNIWLAFPSTDRNKLDIDDYLILKKGAGLASRDPITGEINNVIKQKAQYKILDIKNEAPDFIKRKETLIASFKHTINTASPRQSSGEIFKSGDLPADNDINFSVNHDEVANSSVAKLHEDFNKDSEVEYHISLSNTDTDRVSNRYKVIDLHGDDTGGPTWFFTLENPFGSEINDFTNDESGHNSTEIIDNTYLNIYRTAIDKSASHKFDGRFFVKIFNDDIFRKALKEPIDEAKPEYKSTGVTRKIYSLTTNPTNNRIKRIGYDDGGTAIGEVSNAFDGTILDSTLATDLNKKVAGGKTNRQDALGNPLFTWKNFHTISKSFYEDIGTLNGSYRKKDTDGETRSNSPLRHSAVWMDYDAYFRGVNVYAGNDAIKDRVKILDTHSMSLSDTQKFQDVWFIDGDARHAGNFRFSNIASDGETDDFWSSAGWRSWPSNWRTNSLGIDSWGSGEGGSSRIELAFGGIQPVKWMGSKTGWEHDPSFYDLENENTNYSEQEQDFINKIAIGSQFRFKEDPEGTIYTITGVENVLKIRYENLTDYAGEFEYTGSDHSWTDGDFPQPPTLSRFHARSIEGKASGMRSSSGRYNNAPIDTSNVYGTQVFKNYNDKTTVEAKSNSIVWRVSSFLRPSNYTRNWRIIVDKAFNDHWNPVEETSSEISGSEPIVLTTNAAGTGGLSVAYTVQTASITGSSTNTNKLSVGMVLKKYNDGSDRTMSPPAIVSKISESAGTYTIYLKTYDGSENWETGVGTPTDIGSGETLYFYQYPMNGLSPNAAKNLNHFRGGQGFGNNTAGTDAVGYTWEWVEEKTSRSEEEILPTNPAVFETRPKDTDTRDLDIYHEASGCIPIYAQLTAENFEELIPIGSTVEFESNNAIPFGTKVYDVDGITGRIILTNNISIQEDEAGHVFLAWLESFGWTPGTIPVPYGGGGGGKIICTELCEQGYITKEVLDLDYRHSDNNMDLATKVGYWKWATPIVNLMRKSNIFTQIVRPFGVAWANEMAHREEPKKYKGNLLGKFLMLVGVPLCRCIGKKEIKKHKYGYGFN